jgi:NAD+ synthase
MLHVKYKEESIDVIKSFIQQNIKESKAKGVVIGLSGGLDSAAVAKLAADSIGTEKVLALMLPEEFTSRKDVEDAKSFAKSTHIEHKIIDISPVVDSFQMLLDKKIDPLFLGNIKARCRMIIIFHYANLMNLVVLGTSNKSELLTGYFTKFGDGASDFLPLGDLYKTQVIELARRIDIPHYILNKAPSAGLWEGQTDEKELGITYEDLDKILLGIELGYNAEEISSNTNIPSKEVKRIQELVKKNIHKRKIPSIPKIGIRTIGLDWRE